MEMHARMAVNQQDLDSDVAVFALMGLLEIIVK